MSTPKVSVIIPVYNTEKYLRPCLDSLISQTLREIEIICIDDGSTDSSRDILQEYQDKDSRIKVLFQKNAGAGIARNKGLAIARGEYLSILDSDDFFDAKMLEEAYGAGKRTSAEIVMFRHNRYDEQTGRRFDVPHMMRKELFPDKDVFTVDEVAGNFYYSIVGWTWDKLFLRSFVEEEKLLFQGTKLHNDMYFTYSALVAAKRITYDGNALMCQRVNRAGSISGSVDGNWRYVIEALSAVKFFLETHDKYEQYRTQFTTYALHMIMFTVKKSSDASKEQLRRVCGSFGFASLGISLDENAVFTEPNDREEAVKWMGVPDPVAAENKKLKKDLEQLRRTSDRKNKALKKKLKSIQGSRSYKIGRAVTWLPRKIKSRSHPG